MTDFSVVIPVRFAATRLPGKPLLDIAGKPMIEHVYLQAKKSGAKRIIIATDDERIRAAAENFGAEVCMTDPQHRTGSDRIAETVSQLNFAEDEIIVNIQGDEPLIPPAVIKQVAENLQKHSQAFMTTLCEKVMSVEELNNPNIVKVVMDKQGFALYFSRASIAWDRDANIHKQTGFSEYARYYRHIGLYAYRVKSLQQYVRWPMDCLEKMEALEQLRILWQGERIHVEEVCETVMPGVDTEEDLQAVREYMNG